MEEAARATDDAGLKRAAMELRPGDARWAASMGRFEAKVAQLRLGGETMLEGLGLPLPDPAKPRFHELVQQIYDEIARQCAPEPLLPSGSGQEAETAAPQLALPQPMEVETPAVGPSAAPPAAQAPAPVQAPAAPASPEALPVEDRLAELARGVRAEQDLFQDSGRRLQNGRHRGLGDREPERGGAHEALDDRIEAWLGPRGVPV